MQTNGANTYNNALSENIVPENIAGIDITHILIAIIVIGVVVILGMILKPLLSYKKNAEDVAFEIARARKKAERKNKLLVAVYNTASNMPIVKRYIKTVRRAYINLCPYDESVLVRLTSETATISFFVSVIGIIAVLSLNLVLEGIISPYSMACACLAVYVLSLETMHIRVRKKEKKMLEDLIHYFETVKHVYLAVKSVPQAVLEAADGMSYEINMHAMQVHDILSGTDRKERVREYALDPRTNQYMKLFISQAYEASERGDKIQKDADSSLFTKNLEFLRVEMMRDAYRKEKRDFKFQGYAFVTCLPIFFMMPLKHWGIDFTKEMADFYSNIGYLVMIIAFIGTLLVYDNVNKVKEVKSARTTKDIDAFDKLSSRSIIRKYMNLVEIRRSSRMEKLRKMLTDTGSNSTLGAFVVRMTLYAIIGTIFGSAFFCLSHIHNREQLISDVNNMDTVVYVASEKQKQAIAGHILDMTKDYLHKENVTEAVLSKDLASRIHISNTATVKNVCTEIQRRIAEYNNEYFHWYEFVLALLFGCGVGFLPYLSLKYRYGIVLSGRNDEIRQFQSIIIMERAFHDVTVRQILEEMETFAVIFKDSIRKCLNCYSAGPQEALLELKDSESDCPEFTEIVDGFLVVESVGVYKAFAEVQNNREMSEGSRAFFEDILLEKKRDITDMITMIPAAIVIGFYFVIPLCYYTFGSLVGMFDMLESFSNY